MRTRAKLGEMTMRVELQAELLEKKGVRGRAEEALEAVGRVSPATRRPYPLTVVCEAWRVARSSVYALRARLGGPLEADHQPGKRGPKTALRQYRSTARPSRSFRPTPGQATSSHLRPNLASRRQRRAVPSSTCFVLPAR